MVHRKNAALPVTLSHSSVFNTKCVGRYFGNNETIEDFNNLIGTTS